MPFQLNEHGRVIGCDLVIADFDVADFPVIRIPYKNVVNPRFRGFRVHPARTFQDVDGL